MNSNLISIDLAKNVFQVCAFEQSMAVLSNKKYTRKQLVHALLQYQPTTVVMEACYTAHYWGRVIQALGHQVKLIPPYQVKPFVTGNKNDHNDAIAIGEASQRPKASFVAVKTLEQQDLQCLQRIKERLVKQRTGTANQLRGFLAEYGVITPVGLHQLKKHIPGILEDGENELTVTARRFIGELYHEIKDLDQKIKAVETEREALLQPNEDYHLLQTIPGMGPAISAGLIARVGDPDYFKNGRQMAAWIGLTPKQHASGDKSTMRGITKRGDQHLRTLLIHGARALINWCHKKNDKLSLWIQSLLSRAHPCKVIVALANKLARIAWAVLKTKQAYRAA